MLATISPEQFAQFTQQAKIDCMHFLPELFLIFGVCCILFGNVTGSKHSEKQSPIVAAMCTAMALFLVTLRWDDAPILLFSGNLRIDRFANFFGVLFLAGTIVTVGLAATSKELADRPKAEFYAILLSGVLGMMIMAEAVDLLMIFVGVELLSIPSYVLTGWIKKSRVSSEAALKYVIYGSVSAGLMIYGFSLFYGMTGSLKLQAIADLVKGIDLRDPSTGNMYAVGLAAFLAFGGFGYKMAAVPMQFWAPDVYQGAPTAVTAWLSVTSKAAGIAVFIRFMDALGTLPGSFGWHDLIALIGAITMTLGNLGALHQTNVKRLLAYSSVAHVGYIFMGLAAFKRTNDPAGWEAVAFYTVAYLLMNLGAFACVIYVANQTGTDELSGYRGLGYRAPRLAAAMTVFLFSLIGIPPTAGFTGKFQLFVVAVNSQLVWLAVVAAVNTAISAYYYAKILRAMYLEEVPESPQPLPVPLLGEAIVAVHLVAVVALGVYIDPLVRLARGMGAIR